MKNMNKGFTSVNTLVAMLISFFVISIIFSSLNILKKVSLKQHHQDVLSALQLYQIFNVSCDVIVNDHLIDFIHLGEKKQLRHVNEKLVVSPGTIIYFSSVNDYSFQNEDEQIFLNLKRNGRYRKFLIGEQCAMDLS